jgi:hypothetical protein
MVERALPALVVRSVGHHHLLRLGRQAPNPLASYIQHRDRAASGVNGMPTTQRPGTLPLEQMRQIGAVFD